MPNDNNKAGHTGRSRETTIIRGICAVLQGMAMPTIQNLDDELAKFGYTVIKKGEPVGQDTRNFNKQ